MQLPAILLGRQITAAKRLVISRTGRSRPSIAAKTHNACNVCRNQKSQRRI